MSKIVPVILSGGAGSRLWPLSSESVPKQFRALISHQSMFQDTLQRVTHGRDIAFERPIIVCGESHAKLARDHALDCGAATPLFLLEPIARNTAPALAAVALAQFNIDPNALMLILPADHVIREPGALHEACRAATAAAANGKIVTFGIIPSGPETGYGYIKKGVAIDARVYEVDAFQEKPNLETAKAFLATGNYAWNAGIFFFRCGSFIQELEKHAPDVLKWAQKALDEAKLDGDQMTLNKDAFSQAPSISIDYAVMEKTTNAAVMPVEMGWSDVGSFDALFDIGTKDEAGNNQVGPVVVFDGTNNLVRSQGHQVAVIGLSNIMVIATENGILVAPLDRAQDVRLAADAFKQKS
jgi:mannose-1-phosphate guanylyltransferase / mannose-6-phosphate isomerase